MSGKASGYAPLHYFDRLKIRAATKHLHSRYASVRHAAHNEIARILKKRQQSLAARLDPRKLARRAWERANYGKLCKCGNCGFATRDKAMFRQHVNGHMRKAADSRDDAASPGLRERQDRTGPAPQPRERTEETRRQGRPVPEWKPRPASRPAPWPTTPGGLSRPPRAPAATDILADPKPSRDRGAPATARGPRAPSGPAAPAAPPRTAPLPHETVRAPRAPRSPGRPRPRLRMPRLRARA